MYPLTDFSAFFPHSDSIEVGLHKSACANTLEEKCSTRLTDTVSNSSSDDRIEQTVSAKILIGRRMCVVEETGKFHSDVL